MSWIFSSQRLQDPERTKRNTRVHTTEDIWVSVEVFKSKQLIGSTTPVSLDRKMCVYVYMYMYSVCILCVYCVCIKYVVWVYGMCIKYTYNYVYQCV